MVNKWLLGARWHTRPYVCPYVTFSRGHVIIYSRVKHGAKKSGTFPYQCASSSGRASKKKGEQCHFQSYLPYWGRSWPLLRTRLGCTTALQLPKQLQQNTHFTEKNAVQIWKESQTSRTNTIRLKCPIKKGLSIPWLLDKQTSNICLDVYTWGFQPIHSRFAFCYIASF